MAKDFGELSQWWGMSTQAPDALMDYNAKRLLIFAPEVDWWTKISSNWPNVVHVPTLDKSGISDKDYEEILKLLVHTI